LWTPTRYWENVIPKAASHRADFSAPPPPELHFTTAVDLGRRIAAGQIASAELVETFLARIDRLQPKLQAFVQIYADDARRAARAADELLAAGIAASSLHGVPFVAKDVFDVRGRPTQAGSLATPTNAAAASAHVISRLQAAGMVLLGKSQTVEFTFGGWGTNPSLGTPWNPWDLVTHRIPGGSSSGSAVAVAAGLAPCALGTDTGGSIRIPAGLCGLVGMKTSPGLVSRAGVVPLSRTHDTVGVLGHSVEDVAHLLAHVQGLDPRDPATVGSPWLDLLKDLEKGIQGLRIGALALEDCGPISAGVERAYRDIGAACSALGAHLRVVRLPRSFEEYMQRAGDIMSAECYATLADVVDDDQAPIDGFIRARVRRGRNISARGYLGLLDYRRLAQREWAEALADTDALLVPTCPFPAIPLTEVDENATPLSRLGRFVNLLDLCAIALPAGLEAGLPVSVQIVAAKFHEPVALRVARALERTTGWGRRHPVGV
jgi:aspartyl-tRNA(Asn)/glutamyl-tRNA(Gln) amidotransferase subunit A